ncbi:MAG: MmgE/PrpD family protein [Chloroflexi bacterium]|nr:MmgE/PrpD family protein [Chloroflexota bacterium]
MSRQAAEFAVHTDLEMIPPRVIDETKLHVLDCIGVTLGGFRTSAAKIAARFSQELGRGKEATVLLTGTKASAPAATFANCVAASTLDYEDGYMPGMPHPASDAIPPALAVGERQDSSGKQVVEALVAGYEVGCRASLILRRVGGFQGSATGGMGAITSAVVSAKLLDLNVDQTAQAIGIAACTYPVTGGFGASHFGGMTKEAIGWGGITGVAAAMLAQKGYTGGFSPLNWRLDGTEPHPYYPLDGKEWELLKTYFKAYPACRFTHAPLDCFFRLARENKLTKDDIASITVEVALRPSLLNTREPIDLEHAQYSIPFVIGAALTYGKVSPDEVAEEKLKDPAILEQAKRVFVKNNPEMESLYPRRYPAIVTIKAKDGRVFSMRKETCTGDFDDPMTVDQLKDKFRAMTVPVIGKARTEKVIDMVGKLEQLPSVRALVNELRPDGR